MRPRQTVHSMAYAKSCFVVNPWRADFESPLLMAPYLTISRYFPLSLATSRWSISPLWACGFRWCGHHGAEVRAKRMGCSSLGQVLSYSAPFFISRQDELRSCHGSCSQGLVP